MSEDITTPQDDSSEFTDLLSGLAKRKNGTLVANRYRIEKHLGGGGMGDVYLVADTELKDEYRALKLIKGQFVSNETDLKRFQNEVRLTSRLDHPNIVRVFEYGVDDGELFYTMQYVKGKSLRELLEDHDNKLPLDRALEILTELARALEHAHAQKVIHRDLKPENIIIPDDGSPIKLTDFGLARSVEENEERLTKLDSALGGTANYMSPEQAAESTDIDHRSDIYSFGILAFELATGRVPFEGLPGIVKHMHREEPIPSPKKFNRKLPGWFINIIEACTKKNKEERYQSFTEIARVLEKQSYSFHWRSTRSRVYAAMFALLGSLFCLYCTYPFPNFSGSGVYNHKLQEKVLDMFFKLRGPIKPPEETVVILLDDESKRQLVGQDDIDKPWPRKYLAELLEKLSHAKTRAVILDSTLRGRKEPLEDDLRLAKALQLSPTYIAKMIQFKRVGESQLSSVLIEGHSIFRNAAKGEFLANLKILNNRVRRFKYGEGTENHVTPMAKIIQEVEGTRPAAPEVLDYLNFYGPAGTIKTYSLHEILKMKQGKDLEAVIADKYVFIGAEASVAGEQVARDKFLTSYDTLYTPGVEIHATALQNILKQQWIRRLPLKSEAVINVLLTVLLLYFYLIESKRRVMMVEGTLCAVWLLMSFRIFEDQYRLLPGALSFIVLACGIVVAELHRAIVNKRVGVS